MIKVGTCGWSVRGGRKKYFEVFKLIELQNTFYKLPRKETAIKMRDQAPEDFEFTLKAWQVITHPPSSPTWRKAGLKIEPKKRDKYGFLRPTDENIEAWEKTLEICKALDARICIIQTPPSFRATEENVLNMEKFLTTINRGNIVIGWEPRGDWHKDPNLIKDICRRLDLIHVVDPFKHETVYYHDVCYFRLHGIGPREVNYRYKYTENDLHTLADICKRYIPNCRDIYVLFNNIYMADDAQRFKTITLSKGLPVR